MLKYIVFMYEYIYLFFSDFLQALIDYASEPNTNVGTVFLAHVSFEILPQSSPLEDIRSNLVVGAYL